MEYKQGLEELEKEVHQLRQSMTQPQPENREQGESLLHGAVRNPDRNDEQETRKWQVGDGLERVEPVQAKEAAFTESPKRQAEESPAHTPPEPEPIAGKSAEQTAERMNSLKAEYIRMELSITQQQAAASSMNQEYRQVQSRIEDLKGRTETVEQYSQKIEQLQSRRSSLGVFSGKEKKEIDSQVKRLEQSKAQALQSLVRDYGIQPQAAPDKIKELEQTAAKLQEQRSSLPDINAMREQQKTIGEEYQKEKAAAAQHPETDKIKQLTREQEHPAGQSMSDRMAAAKAESRLEQVSHAPSKTQERNR